MNKSDEAKKLLDRLANICGPVMAKRNWRVKCLKEFYPKNAGLLGLNANRGVSIFIRLRPPHDKDSFYPWDHILGTMVHELTHNTVGSHSAEFYKLMDQVHDEVEKSAGSAGTEKASLTNAVFMTESHRLGGLVSVKVNLSKAAADAAVKRAKHSTLSSSSGQKLGGSSIPYADLSAADRRLLAANAAERRLKDDLWCHGDVDLKQFDDDNDDDADGSLSRSNANGLNDKKSHSKENYNMNNNHQVWICDGCSASNNSNSRQCEQCFGSRIIKKGKAIAGIDITYEKKEVSEAKFGNKKFAGCSCRSHNNIDFRSRRKEDKREHEVLVCGHCYEGHKEDHNMGMKKKVKTDINAPLKAEIGKSSIHISRKGTGSSSEFVNRDSSNNNSNNDNSSSTYVHAGNNNNSANTSSSSSSILINRKGISSSSEYSGRNSSNSNSVKPFSSSVYNNNNNNNVNNNNDNRNHKNNNINNNNNNMNRKGVSSSSECSGRKSSINNSVKPSSSIVIDLANSDSDDNNNGNNSYSVKTNHSKEKLLANGYDYPNDDEEVIILGRQRPSPKSTTVRISNQFR
eukprot:CAMPEP_0119040008 /NCGR_PEP_ID=MMETSP1177-20130426/9810_1 /TAXON_ID=2985 /ORGANISM="Ochromonas sp, Strain CCMP1899" /LENGTH=570 /DNA_ID=CAMNT_0007004643 /DNA_START=83 /DNA_END=1795 /DNA_ORIENTATION=+